MSVREKLQPCTGAEAAAKEEALKKAEAELAEAEKKAEEAKQAAEGSRQADSAGIYNIFKK